ncbi:MAG TPA: M56 family metallopeptidase [Chitinophagaceae bacterium]|nr:M56 family metallopeptidase [Chitinophagaceae bacterium]
MNHTNFLESLGWAVLNSLWQMALLWILFQLIVSVHFFRASVKVSLATFFLVSGFCWFIITLWTYRGNWVSTVLTHSAGNEQVYSGLRTILPTASVAYLALLVLPVARFIRNYRYVRLIRTQGLGKIDVAWRLFVQKISAHMGIRKKVAIWISSLVSSPVTVGFLKPVILLPAAALAQLSPQQLEAVILHELAHIRRFDYLLNLLVNFIRTLLYFNPFVRPFIRTIEKERERSCDELVMQFEYSRHEYAAALLTLEQQQQGFRPLLVAAAGRSGDLFERIETILGVRHRPRFAAARAIGVAAAIGCIVAVHTLLRFTSPTRSSSASRSFIAAASPLFADGEAIEMPQSSSNDLHVRNEKNRQRPLNDESTLSHQTQEIVTPAAPSFVAAVTQDIPDLAEEEEAAVKDAVEVSRKLIENSQWKVIENQAADALTGNEKERLRKQVQQELSRYDWKQWEEQLKRSYNYLDWEKINERLQVARGQLAHDSLMMQYKIALNHLVDVELSLKTEQLGGIPDTDVSLKNIERKRIESKKKLTQLQQSRGKRIVHL